MTTLDMTGRLGSTLHGFELDKAYAGDTDEQGRRHGYGTYRFPNAFFTYRGDFVRGAKHGRGRLEMADGGWYEGDFAEDEMTGTGERRWADGRTYEGGFEMGEMHGQGTYVLASGDVYRGAMGHNKREGRGALTRVNGDAYEGEWARDKRNGEGVETLVANGERYEGGWVDDLRCGQGKRHDSAGNAHEGAYADGLPNGPGFGKDAQSGVTYRGEYADGDPVDLPVEIEVEAFGDPEEEGGDPVPIGTEERPIKAKAGEALDPERRVTLRARLPRNPPPEKDPSSVA